MRRINHLILLAFLVGCAFYPTSKLKAYETDVFYEKISLENKNLLDGIKKEAPELFLQIKKDSTDNDLKSFWGQSLNFDSGAKSEILEKDKIISLVSLFDLSYDENNLSVHAGVMHTYAYLFSTLKTPYGFKRERWISNDLKLGIGLSQNSLGPSPKEGTLLSNLTYFIGKITLKNNDQIKKLNALKNVSSELLQFSFKDLELTELEERVTQPKSKEMILRTFFVKFKNTENLKNQFLLIYLSEDLASGIQQFVTAFPITKESYLKAIDPILLGKDRPILIRYNAFLGQTKDDRFSGDRVILNR